MNHNEQAEEWPLRMGSNLGSYQSSPGFNARNQAHALFYYSEFRASHMLFVTSHLKHIHMTGYNSNHIDKLPYALTTQ